MSQSKRIMSHLCGVWICWMRYTASDSLWTTLNGPVHGQCNFRIFRIAYSGYVYSGSVEPYQVTQFKWLPVYIFVMFLSGDGVNFLTSSSTLGHRLPPGWSTSKPHPEGM